MVRLLETDGVIVCKPAEERAVLAGRKCKTIDVQAEEAEGGPGGAHRCPLPPAAGAASNVGARQGERRERRRGGWERDTRRGLAPRLTEDVEESETPGLREATLRLRRVALVPRMKKGRRGGRRAAAARRGLDRKEAATLEGARARGEGASGRHVRWTP